mmetsp:Transcript_3047/g.6747  ORF Transcript_3047/g.6747 Transcript_3047/m.6747 type:complete len:880 (-) Transcript_3047:141-2780(-)
MVKATKRSRKFIAKGGTPKSQLDKKKGASLTKKGKTKRPNNKHAGKKGGDSGNGNDEDTTGREKEEAERQSNDFLNADNLGRLDMDSFFEKAVGLAEDDDDDDKSSDADGGDNKDGDDDDSSVDSYGSLPSEEEDVEASEAAMKATLEKMSKKDPDFHKYLKENENSLLEFGDDEDDDEGVEDDYVQDEDAMEAMANELADDDLDDDALQKKFRKQQKAASNKFLLTPQRLQQLEQGAFQSHSVRGLKRIIAAYGTACHLSDANGQEKEAADSDDEDGGSGGGRRRKKEFQITSPVVFDRLMAVCLVQCHEEFHYHLLGKGSGLDDANDGDESDEESSSASEDGDTKMEKDKEKPTTTIDENLPLHPKKLSKSPHLAAIQPLLESFIKSTHHILTEAGKEAKLLRFVLSSLAKYVPYLTLFPKVTKPFLKTCVQLWSAPLDTSEEYNAVRLQAFLRIRQLAITQPYPFIEDALKSTYLSYAKRSKFGTAANVTSVLPTLTFMGNCIVELYGLDYASSYQHAFVYIRQLALHLRNALMKQTEESRATVLCWQYVHCLKLWVAVLCAAKGGTVAGKDEEANSMQSLVYPLTEIVLGTCRLVPVARYVPLRLHCVRLLQQLAASTETFIPTTSILMGVLDLKEVGMKPLGGGGKKKGGKKKGGQSSSVQGLRLPLILKLPKEGTLRTMEQLDGVLKEVFVLLNREADMYRYSPGFPEFTFAILQRLRKFNKEISNGRWRAYSKGAIELCEKYSAFASEGRSTLVDAPKDVRRLEALKPTNVPSMRERYETAVAKEKRLEAATQPLMKKVDQKKANEQKRKRKVKGDSDSESDVEMEEEEEVKQTKPKKKKKKAVVIEADLKNVGALKEADEVKEGIEWSDSE